VDKSLKFFTEKHFFILLKNSAQSNKGSLKAEGFNGVKTALNTCFAKPKAASTLFRLP
jgi:hypothetical protein